jgi:hypothetical protein
MRRNFWIFFTILFTGFLIAGCSMVSRILTAIPMLKPTITSVNTESKVCQGKIQASAPIIVRPDGIGGTDSNEFGRFASDPEGASTSAGILVTWTIGVDGQHPEPNTYVRLLDDNANPVGDMSIPFETSVAPFSQNFMSKDDGAAITFCALGGDERGITSVTLDPDGAFISKAHLFSKHSSCPFGVGESIWTGSRMIFAWTEKDHDDKDYFGNVILNIADGSGNSISEENLRTDGEAGPHLAIGHERVLLVVPTRTGEDWAKNNRGQTHLALHRFDLEGKEIGNPVIFDAIPIIEETQTFLGEFAASYVVPTADGWLLLGVIRSSPLGYIAQLTPDGSLVPGSVHIDRDIDFNRVADVIPYWGGAALRIGNSIYFLSSDGQVKNRWDSGEALGQSDLFVYQGHLFLINASEPEGDPATNHVLIRGLQCVP